MYRVEVKTSRTKMYRVEVKTSGEWTKHSDHESYREAIEQSQMVGGRVMCGFEFHMSDENMCRYAVEFEGFDGDVNSWKSLCDGDRDEYESRGEGVLCGWRK